MAVAMDEFGTSEFLQLCQERKMELDPELLDSARVLLDRCGDDVRRRYTGTSIPKVMRAAAIVEVASSHFVATAFVLHCSASVSGGDCVLTSDQEAD